MVSVPAEDLSVIIVSYNSIDPLKNCLNSILSTLQDTKFRVYVVDNNSLDGTPKMLRENFPQVSLIVNSKNEGFAKANNQALKIATGRYVLLLNPDTIVFDHTFDVMAKFMDEHPEAAVASCKLLRPDGRLDLACRRSFPSPFDGFCRAIGLSKLFPSSPLFARYNLTYLDENETYEVDAVNGAFMIVRRAALNEVGLLDEDYFLFTEDMDWCYRFKKAGWKIYYYPQTQVIHAKGESSKKVTSAIINEFFKSMKIFYGKHYGDKRSYIFSKFVKGGIEIWKIATLIKHYFSKGGGARPWYYEK